MNGWRWPQNEDVIVFPREEGNYRVLRESTGEERFCDGEHTHNPWETAASDYADWLASTTFNGTPHQWGRGDKIEAYIDKPASSGPSVWFELRAAALRALDFHYFGRLSHEDRVRIAEQVARDVEDMAEGLSES